MHVSTKSLPAGRSAFTLVEMVVVIAIIVILMVAGLQVFGDSGGNSRKTATDAVTGLIEQARTTAITSRTTVVLAIAEPGDLPIKDGRCRIGLFRVPVWPADATSVDAVLIRRWQTLPAGVVLLGGEVDGVRNPLDEPQITLRYGTGAKALEISVHSLAFGPRGGLHWPSGSDPMALRIAEGAYRNGKASPNFSGGNRTPAETRLKIGRIVARPYRTN